MNTINKINKIQNNHILDDDYILNRNQEKKIFDKIKNYFKNIELDKSEWNLLNENENLPDQQKIINLQGINENNNVNDNYIYIDSSETESINLLQNTKNGNKKFLCESNKINNEKIINDSISSEESISNLIEVLNKSNKNNKINYDKNILISNKDHFEKTENNKSNEKNLVLKINNENKKISKLDLENNNGLCIEINNKEFQNITIKPKEKINISKNTKFLLNQIKQNVDKLNNKNTQNIFNKIDKNDLNINEKEDIIWKCDKKNC